MTFGVRRRSKELNSRLNLRKLADPTFRSAFQSVHQRPNLTRVVRPIGVVGVAALSRRNSDRARRLERAAMYRWAAGGSHWQQIERTALDRFVRRHLERIGASEKSGAVRMRSDAFYDYAYNTIPTARMSEEPFLSDASLTWWAFQYPRLASSGGSSRLATYFATLCNDLDRTWHEPLSTELRSTVANRVAKDFAYLPLLFTDDSTLPAAKATARWMEHELSLRYGPIDSFASARFDRTPKSRVRVGVIVRDTEPRTESFIAASFASLPNECFERVLISFSPTASGSFGDHLQERFDSIEVIETDDLPGRVAKLRTLNLDVAIFANTIAAHATPYFQTMAHRVAPLQILPTAIAPTTSGLSSMDVVLTSAGTEPPCPQSHYSERVVKLSGPFQCFDFGGPLPGDLPREELPGDWPALLRAASGPLIATGASLFKFTAPFREAIERILDAVPAATLVCYPFNPNWGVTETQRAHAELRAVFQDAGIDSGRVLVMPALSRAQVVTALRSCTVFLDAFPYSGAASLLDPLAVRCPPVVLRGNTQRGLQAASILEDLELAAFVADDVDRYVRSAINLATDPDARLKAAALIPDLSETSSPFNIDAYGKSLHDALLQALGQDCDRPDCHHKHRLTGAK